MTDVLFITPTVTDNVFEESVGTLLLATILRQNNVNVEILPFFRIGDPSDFECFLNKALDIVSLKQPKIISFYTRCDCYHIMLKLAEQFKKHIGSYIVFDGPQSDITAKETLEEIPYVDYICRGEGETTIYPFFSSLLNDAPDLSVRGLVYRGENGIIVNPRPELIADLDSLPLIDYSIFPPDSHFNINEPFPIDVGRGCPFGCTYCSTNTFWGRKYRLKSPACIVKEIKHYHDTLGVTYFAFEHDMFTMNKKQVMETCRLIEALDFRITWKCSARIDCLDEELIDVMVSSGLKRIFIGIETGSERMQKLVNKNLKLSPVLDMLSYINSKGISIITSFIFGFPEETEEDFSKTLSMIVEIEKFRKIITLVHLCTFLPGTALSEKYKDSLTPSTSFSDITGDVALNECKDLIMAHPRLFWHFSEYNTELRTKLQHFTLFLRVFITMRPVYLCIAEKYTPERMIDMYFDFVRANEEILISPDYNTGTERLMAILKNDGLAKMFADSPYADVIADIYRLEYAKLSVTADYQKNAVEITSISPAELNEKGSFKDCERKLFMVSYSKLEDGSLQTKIRHS